MLIQRDMYLEHEVLKWLALIVCAGALVLAAARPASGDGSRATPVEFAARILPQIEAAFSGSAKEGSDVGMRPTAERLWAVLDLHRTGRFEEAVRRWNELSLPERAQSWKAVGVGAASLQLGNLDEAARTLSTARERDPGNALVHYYLGVVRLTQSTCVRESHDAAPFGNPLLVSPLLSNDNQNLHQGYLDFARVEFEKAVELAADLRLDQPLIPTPVMFVRLHQYETVYPNRMLPRSMPSVRDLLRALNAEDYEGKAHVALAGLSMDRGALEEAETHLDAAFAAGEHTAAEYKALGRAYELGGLYADAVRAFMKGMKGTTRIAVPATRAIENIKQLLD